MKALLLPDYARPATAPVALPVSSAPTLWARAARMVRVLHGINAPLSLTGWLLAALALAALVAWPLDARLITGAPAWLKPLKFALSLLAYVWTLAWLLADLPAVAQRAVRVLSWGVALSVLVEILVIFTQAARGTTSHYNTGHPLDALLFGLMGIFIGLNTVLIVAALYLASRYRPEGAASYAWGVRLGLLFFLVGSAVGGMMIHHLGHTIGAADGGPGLPGLGWSTRAGDLRIAHFLGLHALQALPLLGWATARWAPQRAVALTGLGAALYAAAVAALYAQAMAGHPAF